MKKRAFFIPMFICLGIAVVAFSFAFTYAGLALEALFEHAEGSEGVANALVTIFGLIFFFPCIGASTFFCIPTLILAGIYNKKAKRLGIIRWPGIMSLVMSICMLVLPVLFIIFLMFL